MIRFYLTSLEKYQTAFYFYVSKEKNNESIISTKKSKNKFPKTPKKRAEIVRKFVLRYCGQESFVGIFVKYNMYNTLYSLSIYLSSLFICLSLHLIYHLSFYILFSCNNLSI